jgi:multiple sugar transport system ATP-binding protein
MPGVTDAAVPHPAGTHTVGIRPEHAQIDATGPLSLTVTQVEQLGSTSLLLGTIGGKTPFEVVCPGQTPVARGDTVHVALPAAHLHCFDAQGERL